MADTTYEMHESVVKVRRRLVTIKTKPVLNVSKIMKEKLSYTQTGTPFYASPEIWRDKPYDFKSDVWSLGVIIYELCQLSVPFKADNIDDLYKKVCRGTYSAIPGHYSRELSALIK